MSGKQTRRIGLKISSDPANLAGVRHAVEQLCAEEGFDAESAGQIGLCVNEALANVIVHAYGGASDRPIELAATCRADEVEITIRDWGPGVTPPDVRPIEQRELLRPGGLGLVCLRQMMDRVIYTPKSDGMLLTMVRRKPL